jgi:hypothetical protein
MIEAARTSETSLNFYQTKRCNIPEDSRLHPSRRENLKSHLAEGKIIWLDSNFLKCFFWKIFPSFQLRLRLKIPTPGGKWTSVVRAVAIPAQTRLLKRLPNPRLPSKAQRIDWSKCESSHCNMHNKRNGRNKEKRSESNIFQADQCSHAGTRHHRSHTSACAVEQEDSQIAFSIFRNLFKDLMQGLSSATRETWPLWRAKWNEALCGPAAWCSWAIRGLHTARAAVRKKGRLRDRKLKMHTAL